MIDKSKYFTSCILHVYETKDGKTLQCKHCANQLIYTNVEKPKSA